MSRTSKNPAASSPPPSAGAVAGNGTPGVPTETPPTFVKSWINFWFKPQDPIVLCMMRVFVGMITLYTFFVHSITLQEFMGPHAWLDLQMRRETLDDRPQQVSSLLFSPLSGGQGTSLIPPNQANDPIALEYKNTFGVWPPFPAADNAKEAKFAIEFRRTHGIDFRYYGLPFPQNEREHKIIADYMAKWHHPFPPPYPANEKEIEEIDAYKRRHGPDPRLLYARGIPLFSVWMHVVDPFWMNLLQTGFVVAALCFLLGLGTRVSTPIVWFANICYIHRNPIMLFGVDTMMNVVLLYMIIAPCGARLSLDSLIVRWWRTSKGLPYVPPGPSVSAGVALRLLQIHLCIIYCISGLAKLVGQSWWSGTAVWSVIANYEFAPMEFMLFGETITIYSDALRLLGSNQLFFDTFIAGSGMFTIAFEISYPYLVWRPKSRWLMLAGAVMLHGGIGMFMGLKTFSLMMIAFNMAFLKPSEGRWMLSWLGITDPAPSAGAAPPPPTSKAPVLEPVAVPASAGDASTAVQVK